MEVLKYKRNKSPPPEFPLLHLRSQRYTVVVNYSSNLRNGWKQLCIGPICNSITILGPVSCRYTRNTTIIQARDFFEAIIFFLFTTGSGYFLR